MPLNLPTPNAANERKFVFPFDWELRTAPDDFGDAIHWMFLPRGWHVGTHGYHVEHIDACMDNVSRV